MGKRRCSCLGYREAVPRVTAATSRRSRSRSPARPPPASARHPPAEHRPAPRPRRPSPALRPSWTPPGSARTRTASTTPPPAGPPPLPRRRRRRALLHLLPARSPPWPRLLFPARALQRVYRRGAGSGESLIGTPRVRPGRFRRS
jgi:hypothetical protein